jgi:hypothetical protein
MDRVINFVLAWVIMIGLALISILVPAYILVWRLSLIPNLPNLTLTQLLNNYGLNVTIAFVAFVVMLFFVSVWMGMVTEEIRIWHKNHKEEELA